MKKYIFKKNKNKLKEYDDEIDKLKKKKFGKLSFFKKYKNNREINKVVKDRENYLESKKTNKLLMLSVLTIVIIIGVLFMFGKYFDDQDDSKSINNNIDRVSSETNSDEEEIFSEEKLLEYLLTFKHESSTNLKKNLQNVTYPINFVTLSGDSIKESDLKCNPAN